MDTKPTKKRKDETKNNEKPIVAKTAYDLQRLKLMKLMKNPEKPVLLPDRPKSKNSPSVPEFVRNVMGSSAGAGSGEFHVYRHLRRKEYSRQKFIQDKGRKESLDDEYHEKLKENKLKAEQTTAKKRAKRLKKKQTKKVKSSETTNKKDELNRSSDSCDDSDTSNNMVVQRPDEQLIADDNEKLNFEKGEETMKTTVSGETATTKEITKNLETEKISETKTVA